MQKTLIIIMIFMLTACGTNRNQIIDLKDDPKKDEVNEQLDHPDEDKRIVFDNDIHTNEIIEDIQLEILLNRSKQDTIYLDDYNNPSFYFVSHEKIFFNGASIEGTAIYNSEIKELSLNFTITVGSSTGAMDGDHLDYALNLADKNISNLVIHEWTGKRDIDIYAKNISEEDFIDFGFSIYSTIKAKYEDWNISSEEN